MAVQSPSSASSRCQLDALNAGPSRSSLGRGGPHGEGRAEQLASWLLVFLAAFLGSLALGASVWALGLAR